MVCDFNYFSIIFSWIVYLESPITTLVRIGIAASLTIALFCYDICVEQIIVGYGPSALSWINSLRSSLESSTSFFMLLPIILD